MEPESTTSYIMRTIGMIFLVAAILFLVTSVLTALAGNTTGTFSIISCILGALTVIVSWSRGSVVMSPDSYLPRTFMLTGPARDSKTDLRRSLSFPIIGGFAGLIVFALGILVSLM